MRLLGHSLLCDCRHQLPCSSLWRDQRVHLPATMGPAGAATEGAANKLMASLAAGAVMLPSLSAWKCPKGLVLQLSSAAARGSRSRKVLLLNSGVLLGRAVSVRHTCRSNGARHMPAVVLAFC